MLQRIAAAAITSVASSCALDQPVSLREQGICRTRQTSRHWALQSAYGHQYSEPPGRNHYRLIAHLAEKFTIACGAQGLKVCDVGTNHGDSVRAWVSSPLAQVATFDLEDAPANIGKWGGQASAHTSAGVREYFGPNVTFYRGDLLKNAALFRTCADSTLMLLDTAHYPETDPFELGFVKALHAARYNGIVLMNDIRLGRQMKGFWAWVAEFAQRHGYHAHDLTRVGHFSGTGLLDFSGGKLLRNLVAPAPPARCNCEPATIQSCRGPVPPAEKRKLCSIVKTKELTCDVDGHKVAKVRPSAARRLPHRSAGEAWMSDRRNGQGVKYSSAKARRWVPDRGWGDHDIDPGWDKLPQLPYYDYDYDDEGWFDLDGNFIDAKGSDTKALD